LAGHLLLYYAANNVLPATLDDLAVAFALSSEDVICPVSRRPYGYDPNGVVDRITENVLIVFDPVPAHAGLRWAVAVGPPDGGPLVTKIVAVSEGNVVWPPAAEPRR
jgi:hypothetical protein